MTRKNSKRNTAKYTFLPSSHLTATTRRATHQTPRAHCSVVRKSVRMAAGASAVWARPLELGARGGVVARFPGNIRPISRLLGLSSPAPTTMNANQNETDNSPANAAEHGDEEAWSGEDDSELDAADASGKRKRQRLSRPLSVSCELCKSRKVCRPHLSICRVVASRRELPMTRRAIIYELELTKSTGQV